MEDKAFKEIVNTCSEIDLYFIINECGGFIWRMNHDIADGRIQSNEEIEKDIMRIKKDQILAVSKTVRFGVDKPFQGENKTPTEKYWEWFRAWDSYIKDLSEDEWQILKKKIENGEDYSNYRPEKIF